MSQHLVKPIISQSGHLYLEMPMSIVKGSAMFARSVVSPYSDDIAALWTILEGQPLTVSVYSPDNVVGRTSEAQLRAAYEARDRNSDYFVTPARFEKLVEKFGSGQLGFSMPGELLSIPPSSLKALFKPYQKMPDEAARELGKDIFVVDRDPNHTVIEKGYINAIDHDDADMLWSRVSTSIESAALLLLKDQLVTATYSIDDGMYTHVSAKQLHEGYKNMSVENQTRFGGISRLNEVMEIYGHGDQRLDIQKVANVNQRHIQRLCGVVTALQPDKLSDAQNLMGPWIEKSLNQGSNNSNILVSLSNGNSKTVASLGVEHLMYLFDKLSDKNIKNANPLNSMSSISMRDMMQNDQLYGPFFIPDPLHQELKDMMNSPYSRPNFGHDHFPDSGALINEHTGDIAFVTRKFMANGKSHNIPATQVPLRPGEMIFNLNEHGEKTNIMAYKEMPADRLDVSDSSLKIAAPLAVKISMTSSGDYAYEPLYHSRKLLVPSNNELIPSIQWLGRNEEGDLAWQSPMSMTDSNAQIRELSTAESVILTHLSNLIANAQVHGRSVGEPFDHDVRPEFLAESLDHTLSGIEVALLRMNMDTDTLMVDIQRAGEAIVRRIDDTIFDLDTNKPSQYNHYRQQFLNEHAYIIAEVLAPNNTALKPAPETLSFNANGNDVYFSIRHRKEGPLNGEVFSPKESLIPGYLGTVVAHSDVDVTFPLYKQDPQMYLPEHLMSVPVTSLKAHYKKETLCWSSSGENQDAIVSLDDVRGKEPNLVAEKLLSMMKTFKDRPVMPKVVNKLLVECIQHPPADMSPNNYAMSVIGYMGHYGGNEMTHLLERVTGYDQEINIRQVRGYADRLVAANEVFSRQRDGVEYILKDQHDRGLTAAEKVAELGAVVYELGLENKQVHTLAHFSTHRQSQFEPEGDALRRGRS